MHFNTISVNWFIYWLYSCFNCTLCSSLPGNKFSFASIRENECVIIVDTARNLPRTQKSLSRWKFARNRTLKSNEPRNTQNGSKSTNHKSQTMTFCFLRGPLRSADSSEFDWRRRKTLPSPCTAFSRFSRSIQFGDVSEANGPFSSPEPLGLICNEPLVSRPRDQETTGSGVENANA